MTQLVRTVRVLMFFTSAVVLVDLQFGFWPCLVYAIAIAAILVSSTIVRDVHFTHRGSPTFVTATWTRHGGCQPRSDLGAVANLELRGNVPPCDVGTVALLAGHLLMNPS